MKHSIVPENIAGEVKEFDDNTVQKNGELEKPILDLENRNRRIDALEILIMLVYDFPKWNQIREIFGYGCWYSDNLTIIKKYLKYWN